MKRIDTIFTRARRWLVAGAVALAASAVAVVPASGQIAGAGGFTDMATRDYLHRDMPIVAQVLELDDNQRVILDNLFEDYVENFESGWKATQDKIGSMVEDMQNVSRENALDMVLRPFEDWKSQKRHLKQQFESGIKSILNERQLEQWPEFERRILREKRMHEGRLDGENVNLFHIVRDLRLDERSRLNIEPILEQYAVELHEALKRRTEAIQTAHGDMFQMIRANENLSAQAQAARQVVNHHVAVRDINERYRDRLAASLPHETGQELKLAALERGYPRVFRELPATRMYRQALELEELDEETIAAVEDLHAIYKAEMDVLNSRLLNTIREFEPRQVRNQIDLYVARQQGERGERLDDPSREELRHRSQRADYYVTLLRELLGEEQFAQLPAARYILQEAERRAAAHEARERIRQHRATEGGVPTRGATRGGRGGQSREGRDSRQGRESRDPERDRSRSRDRDRTEDR